MYPMMWPARSAPCVCVNFWWARRIDAKMFTLFLSNFAAIFHYQFATEKATRWNFFAKILPFTLSSPTFPINFFFICLNCSTVFQAAPISVAAVVCSLFLSFFFFLFLNFVVFCLYLIFLFLPANFFALWFIYGWVLIPHSNSLCWSNKCRSWLKSSRKKFARILTEN